MTQVAGTATMQSTLAGSNTGRFRDRAPEMPAAGKVQSDMRDTVGNCVRFDSDRPGTPETIAPFRKSQREVGRPVPLKGQHGDPPPPDIRFGRRSVYHDGALTLIQADKSGRFLQKRQELKEAIYATSKKEPLGRTRDASHTLPKEALDPNRRFGRVTKTSENAKKVIYPSAAKATDDEDEVHRKRYCMTHNSFEAGEQKKRSYDWERQGIDPKAHRFGYTKEAEREGVKQAMVYGCDDHTRIVQKTIEDFKDVTKDELGKPKNQGFGSERQNLPPNFTFGKKNVADEWGVKECIMKAGLGQDEMTDKDLGKSLRPGFRNETQSDRTFGVPSVRTDVPRPRHRKVTDSVNYGDDENAARLLNPCKYAVKGVHETDFLQPIEKNALKELAAKCEFDLSDSEFEEVFARALSYAPGSSSDRTTIQAFRTAVEELNY